MMTSKQIEKMSEKAVAEMAEEALNVKGFNVYLVDLEGRFGYSAIVFGNGRQIIYANDYQLHHSHKSKKELKTWYIETMTNKLFTENEIIGPLKDYDEYRRKYEFLQGKYSMLEDYQSVWRLNGDGEIDKNVYKYFDALTMGYYKNKEFVKKHLGLLHKLEEQRGIMEKDPAYMQKAFLTEMYNHEYMINLQADYDVLSCFGNIEYKGNENDELDSYFEQLDFDGETKLAYLRARKEYFKSAGDY